MKEGNENSAIFDEVAGIIKDITGNPGLKIEPAHTANDIRNWDSLRHVMIIDKVERHFAIQFDLTEMLEINTVGDLCKVVSRKKAKIDDHPGNNH
jgi:acyl carrier protein